MQAPFVCHYLFTNPIYFSGLGHVLAGIPIYYFVWKHKHVVEEAPVQDDKVMVE